jgi:hypothetical protein
MESCISSLDAALESTILSATEKKLPENFILLFNNSNFINYTLINTLKRWLIYQINKRLYTISEDDESNIYNKIIIIRTYQPINIIEYDANYENLEKIILAINNINFKKYSDAYIYNNDLIDLIIKYFKLNSDIVIINSSNNHLLINDIYEKILNNEEEILIENKKLIVNIDISKNKFYFKDNLFVQFFIDSRSLHIKDIISIELINYFNGIINNDKNNNLKNNKGIIKYLNLFEEYENNCIFNKTCDHIIIEELENIKLYEIKDKSFELYFNLLIKNVIKNIKRTQSQIIEIPVDNIDKDIYNSNIKYILEFYSIIYPKLLNNYNDSKFKNNLLLKKNIKINKLIIKKNNKIELDENDLSLSYTISNITMTNWIDEYNDYNPFGILIKYNISKYSYKGLIDEKSTIIKTFPNMVVDNISNNWISMYDYYQLIISYKNDDNDDNNDNNNYEEIDKTNKFNLNNFKLNDIIHGESNIMLPLYINKNHWNLAKSLWNYHITFINNSFESEYNKKMDNIYYLTLLKCFTNLLDNNLTDNKIILFIYILRTTIQISIDNKFINTISTEYNRYFNYLISLNKINKEEKSLLEINLIDYIIRFIQYCVSFCDISNLKKDLNKIRDKIFDEWFKKQYSCNIIYKEYYNNLNEQNKNKEMNLIKNNFITEYANLINLEIILLKFSKVINSIYKIKGFNQFIKYIDNKNCYIDNSSEASPKLGIPEKELNNKEEITFFNIKNIITNCKNLYDNYIEDIKLIIKI